MTRDAKNSSPQLKLKTVTVWLNAFIRRDVMKKDGTPLTFALPGGPFAGHTAVPGPLFAVGFRDCYLTDNRDFDPNLGASSRFHTEITIDFSGGRPVITKQTQKCDETVRLKADGTVLNRGVGTVRGGLRLVKEDARSVEIDVNLSATNPVAKSPPSVPAIVPTPIGPVPVPLPVPIAEPKPGDRSAPAPAIDLEGRITIDAGSGRVAFDGRVDGFPFFEMYAAPDNGGTGRPVFQIEPPAGNTPWNLVGAPNRDVAKILGKPAEITF
jgi:hypothetical protein